MFSQDSLHCSSSKKSKSSSTKWANLNTSKEKLSSCQCSMTSHGDQIASQMLNSFLYLQEDLGQDNGHSLVLVQRKGGIL